MVEEVKAGQNIMRQGSSLRRGEIVLPAGQEIRPAEVGLLAEVGRANVLTYPRPRVAVLSTGNELVEAHELPAAGQIRNSNGPLLSAAVRRSGGTPIELGIARDDAADLRAKIEQGLAADILVLSGGVSMGVLDLVPRVLTELGVEQVFHKVNLKPGKPLWFGTTGSRSKVQGSRSGHQPETLNLKPGTLVFGVPGNPVSGLVCFELFVRPAIARLAGREPDAVLRRLDARLTKSFAHRGDRPTYFPAIVRRVAGDWTAEPVEWRGSADLRGITRANALIVFPAGDRAWQPGDVFETLLL
jgi:molybdopterin molybdotransferase